MKLWGGRFEDGPHASAWAFTVSKRDRRLLEVDVAGSVAHVQGLLAAGLVSDDEGSALISGLHTIASEARGDEFTWSEDDEDVHSAVERRLGELIGGVAGKLHTGRSRNDQIALDIRLYLREVGVAAVLGLRDLVGALVDAAEAAGEEVVASYTHLQHAQAVPFAHHLLAHAWAFSRDIERFNAVASRLDESPLGAGAGGGSSLGLQPAVAAGALGMGSVFENSMDAVASRDVATEFAYCSTQALVHLSRLGEELVLWASTEFNWATFRDAFTTGSSAMPQKKNPDVAELARGKAGSAIGSLTALLAIQKGLPLTYNRDLQEDKEHLFTLTDDLIGGLMAVTGMVRTADFHPQPPTSWVTALDLAEVLVARGLPFREAHEVIGRVVQSLMGEGRVLADLGGDELAACHPLFEVADAVLTDPLESVRKRVSYRGGSFDSVASQIEALRST